MKCGLSAKAAETARASISIASSTAIANRRMVVLLSNTMRAQSNSVHRHTTGSSNREALQATKVFAHDEQTLEKHALLNAHTKAWLRVQEEVVQNRQRDVVTQAW